MQSIHEGATAGCTQRNRSGRRYSGKTAAGSIDCAVAVDDEAGGYADDADSHCSANEVAAQGWSLIALNWEAQT